MLLHATGIKNREIARQLNVHHNTVSYWLNKNSLRANYFGQSIDIIDDEFARCRKCFLIKSLKEFQFGRKGKKYEYRFSYCNECRKKQVYLNLNGNIEKFLIDRFNRLKQRAKKLNIQCAISQNEFVKQYHNQNDLCFFTNIKLICEVGSRLHRDSLSIDKLIPENGYCTGNVVFTTHRINTCKCDLSLEEIKQWMPTWYKKIFSFLEKNKMDKL